MSSGRLLWAAVRSARARRMNRDLVGWRVERQLEPVRLEDMQAFARATRDANPAYQGPQAVAPPLFIVRLVYPMLLEAMLQPRLRMNLLRMVHGEMDVEWRAPIRPGDQLQLSMGIAAIEDTPAGELLRLAGEARRDGALLVRALAGLLVRGRGGKRRSGPAAEEATAERFRRELVTEDGQQLEYARASGDRNFIHTSRLLARLAGLPRTIMHGMCVFAMSAAGLVDELADGDPTRLVQLRGRFSRPVIPGWRLSLVGYSAADCSQNPFAVFGPAGEPVIKKGRATIGQPAARK